MTNLENSIWRGTAEQASTETDSKKLMALVEQLCREIDRSGRPVRTPSLAFVAA